MHAQMPWSNQGTAYGGGPGQGGSLVPKQMLGNTDWPTHNPSYISQLQRHTVPPETAPPFPLIPSHISPDPPPAAPRPPPRAYHIEHDCTRRPSLPDCIDADKELHLSYSYAWEPSDRPSRMPDDFTYESPKPQEQVHERGGHGDWRAWAQSSGSRDVEGTLARQGGGARRMGIFVGASVGAGAGLLLFVSVEALRRWRRLRCVHARMAWRRRCQRDVHRRGRRAGSSKHSKMRASMCSIHKISSERRVSL